jgi:hypothetical protein
MSKFQSTISTFAALGTIAVTAVTAYKTFENHKVYSAEQDAKIEELKTQLKQQQAVVMPPPVELPPVIETPDPTKSGSAQAPAPPTLPSTP